MSNFLRALWKQKPQAYGSVEAVQRDIRLNAERVGIDPGSIKRFYALWEKSGDTAYDLSPQGKNATLWAGVSWIQNGIYFNSSGGIPFLDTGVVFSQDQDPLTYLISINMPAGTNNGCIFGEFQEDTSYTRNYLYNVYNDIGFDQYPPYGGVTVSTGFLTSSFNMLVKMCVVKNKDIIHFYKNGSLFSFAAHTETYSGSPPTIGGFGARPNGTGGWMRYFKGEMYLAAIFSTALSSAQIALLSDHPYLLLARNPARTWFIPPESGLSLSLNTSWRIRNLINKEVSWEISNGYIGSTETSWLIEDAISSNLSWSVLDSNSIDLDWKVSNHNTAYTSWYVKTVMSVELSYKLLASNQLSTSWDMIAPIQFQTSWRVSNKAETNLSWTIKKFFDLGSSWSVLTEGLIVTEYELLTSEEINSSWTLCTMSSLVTEWATYDTEATQLITSWSINDYNTVDTSFKIVSHSTKDSAWKVMRDTEQLIEWSVINKRERAMEYSVLHLLYQMVRWSVGDITGNPDATLRSYVPFDDFVFKPFTNFIYDEDTLF